MARPADVHTARTPVPPLDDELAGLLEDLEGVHAGIDLIRDGIRLLALERHTASRTQTIVATLAGIPDLDVVSAIGLLVARLTDADSNPALRTIPTDRQKEARRYGELVSYNLADPELHQSASEAVAAIDGI
jgi:hypothetical protein